MPFASIKITREPRVTREQKAELIARVTRAIVEALDKEPDTTFVVVEEIETDAWGVAGESALERRRHSRGLSQASDADE